MKFGIGQSVLRKEDARFLTGEGTYTDDVNIDGQAYVHFLRSPHAHARIRAIDTTDAMNAPGVVAILTGSDVLAADGVSPLPCMASVSALNGDPMYTPPRYVLATDAARYVGEAVAMIIAETPEQAMDAAELIEVDYQALPAVVNTAKAMDADAPQVWPETPFGNNVCVKWENREPEPVMEIFDKAAHVAEINILNNRLMGNPLEPRCAVADYDAKTDTRTLYCPSQGVYRLLRPIADRVFKIPYKKLRIISGDVGGSFGIRSKSYPELIAMVWAVKKLNRPLKWLATRAETMMSDNHARDHVTHAKLALDGNGKIQAMWIDITADMGAYLSDMSVAIPVNVGQRNTGTTYMIPTVYNVINLVFTHRTPVDSYRGAGRPEVVYVMERLMEEAARVTGLDSSEIRKRNYIPADAFPFVNSQGLAIDSGDFLANHDMALKKADWEGFEARRAEARARGKLRGIGIGSFLECSGGTPEEEARIRFEDNGRVSVFAGTFSHGQGHATTFSQIVAERLDVDFDKIDYYDGGDNFVIPFGQGTGGSRSAHMGGSSIAFACDKVIEKAKKIAGHLLQSEPANLTFENGVFRVANGPGSMTLAEVAKASLDTEKLPDGIEPGIDETFHYNRPPNDYNWPNGCHVAEVEIDPETGAVTVTRYSGIDDNGVVLNPMIVHGQVYGGIAQGLGQALLEDTVYDEGSGQLLTASFMDYGMPRASHIPPMDLDNNEVPCTTNPIGVKGCGEGGACGAPPAIVNAVLDALKPLNIHHIDMPLTPEKVWRTIRDGKNTVVVS